MSKSDGDRAAPETQPAAKPSQAEGERKPGASGENTAHAVQAVQTVQAVPKPSQAEGDRETIEEDIRGKEQEGEI